MPRYDYRDLYGGLGLVAIGFFFAFHAMTALPIGTVARMGPGMLPMILGWILVGFGLMVAVPALFRSGEMPAIELRSLVTILTSILVFVVLIRPFGLIPAVFVQTLLASRADSRMSLVGASVVCLVLALGATAIFRFGLGLEIAPFAWPW